MWLDLGNFKIDMILACFCDFENVPDDYDRWNDNRRGWGRAGE